MYCEKVNEFNPNLVFLVKIMSKVVVFSSSLVLMTKKSVNLIPEAYYRSSDRSDIKIIITL